MSLYRKWRERWTQKEKISYKKEWEEENIWKGWTERKKKESEDLDRQKEKNLIEKNE